MSKNNGVVVDMHRRPANAATWQKIQRALVEQIGNGVVSEVTINCRVMVDRFDLRDVASNSPGKNGECQSRHRQDVALSKNSATIQDVAHAAGVSPKTVSLVANGKPGVNAETRKRVETVIESLGYKPNTAARELALARSARKECLPESVNILAANILPLTALKS